MLVGTHARKCGFLNKPALLTVYQEFDLVPSKDSLKTHKKAPLMDYPDLTRWALHELYIPVTVLLTLRGGWETLPAFRYRTQKHSPRDARQLKVSIRTLMWDYRREDWMVNIPLYAIGTLIETLRGP